jgi:hypothetical protein
MSVDVAEARLPALLIQPVLAYYRMYGELPATPGDAYRELRLAMIDAAELELLEHYTPEFYAAVGCIQLRLIPHRGSDDLLEANAFRDPVQSTFVLETRRLPPAAKFTDRLGGELSYSTPGRGSEYTSVFEGPRLTRWATWREADIPVIASPVTDFLRHGPEIPSFVPLTKGQLEALGDSIRIGPVFSKYEESRVAPNGHL